MVHFLPFPIADAHRYGASLFDKCAFVQGVVKGDQRESGVNLSVIGQSCDGSNANGSLLEENTHRVGACEADYSCNNRNNCAARRACPCFRVTCDIGSFVATGATIAPSPLAPELLMWGLE